MVGRRGPEIGGRLTPATVFSVHGLLPPRTGCRILVGVDPRSAGRLSLARAGRGRKDSSRPVASKGRDALGDSSRGRRSSMPSHEVGVDSHQKGTSSEGQTYTSQTPFLKKD